MNHEPDNLVARALKILKEDQRKPSDEVLIEPASPTARPVYWERGDGSIVGPAQPEFLAKVGNGPQASYWVIALYAGQPVWINSIVVRSKKSFEQQVTPKPIELIREPQ